MHSSRYAKHHTVPLYVRNSLTFGYPFLGIKDTGERGAPQEYFLFLVSFRNRRTGRNTTPPHQTLSTAAETRGHVWKSPKPSPSEQASDASSSAFHTDIWAISPSDTLHSDYSNRFAKHFLFLVSFRNRRTGRKHSMIQNLVRSGRWNKCCQPFHQLQQTKLN